MSTIYCEIEMDRDDGSKNEAITGNVFFFKKYQLLKLVETKYF